MRVRFFGPWPFGRRILPCPFSRQSTQMLLKNLFVTRTRRRHKAWEGERKGNPTEGVAKHKHLTRTHTARQTRTLAQTGTQTQTHEAPTKKDNQHFNTFEPKGYNEQWMGVQLRNVLRSCIFIR